MVVVMIKNDQPQSAQRTQSYPSFIFCDLYGYILLFLIHFSLNTKL